MGFQELMMGQPGEIGPGVHAGAALGGLGKGLMSNRMRDRYEAGASGYYDLMKQQHVMDHLHNPGGEDDPEREMAELQAKIKKARGGNQVIYPKP